MFFHQAILSFPVYFRLNSFITFILYTFFYLYPLPPVIFLFSIFLFSFYVLLAETTTTDLLRPIIPYLFHLI